MEILYKLCTTIYYLSTIVFLYVQIEWIMHPIEKTIKYNRYKLLSKEFENKKEEEYSEEYKKERERKLFQIIWITIWLFIGLFTFQWVAFLSIYLLNILIIPALKKIITNYFFEVTINWINSIIGLSFAIFVIINHYHLKIDLTQIFMNLLK